MNSRRVGVIVKRGGLDHGIRTMFLYSCDVKRNDGYLVCSQDVAKFRVGDWIEFVCDATENYFAGKRISEPFRTTADGFELVRAHVRATIFRGVMPVRIGYLCWSPELRYVYIAKDKIASMRQDCLYDVVVTFAINAPSFKVDGKEVYVYWQIEDVVGESADSRAMNEVPWMVKSKVASENTDNTTATASLTETSSTQEKNVKTQPTVDQVEAKKGQGSQWESSDEEKEEPEEEGHFLMIEGQYKAYTRNLSYKLNKNLDLLNTNYNPKPSEKPKNMDEKEEPVGLTMLERERVWSCLREELLENDPNSPIIAKIEARRASFYDGKKGKDFSA